jgi:hypothetical protein
MLFSLALLWLAVAGWLLLQFWPDIPHSKVQWFLFVALGPPLYVLGEGLFTWLFSPAHGRAISQRAFSVARIAIALPVVLGVFALSWWLSWFLSKP